MPIPAQNRLRAAGLGALLFFAAFLLDFGESTRLWELIGDSVHVPIFAFTVFGLCWLFEGGAAFVLRSALGACALVLLIECIQPAFGRSASVVDMQNGFIGIGCGAAAALLQRRFGARAAPAALLILAFGSAWALLPGYGEWRLLELRRAQLPVLSDFERQEDAELWSAIAEKAPVETFFRTPLNPHSGRGALKVNTVPLHYSGVELRLEGMSWEDYKFLELAVFVDEPALFSLRIDDWENCEAFDSRFNRTFELSAGWNRLKISLAEVRSGPKSRSLNLRELKRAMFFLYRPRRARAS